MQSRIPRVLIAGTHSGVGKTTIAIALMAALIERGLRVQAFKVGPDYLDPTYHTFAAGRVSRNLDSWFLNRDQIVGLVRHACSDIDVAILEGMMGLFDGHSSTKDRGSSAEIAKWLDTPVVLVLDASHMARSAAALLQGYLKFDPAVSIVGIIFNKVSQTHAQLLREAIMRHAKVAVLGHLPEDSSLAIPERHLGLVPAHGEVKMRSLITRLAKAFARHVDVDRLLQLARCASSLPQVRSLWPIREETTQIRIGVARDRAFHFYYPENFDVLKALGAELISFSPLSDRHLPEGLDALYLGGGFPECFAGALAKNQSLRDEISRRIRQGVPTYAECGGLMYLTKALIDHEGHRHEMVGALPGSVRMTNRLQHFGYAKLLARRDNVLAEAGESIRGHEFHHSIWDYRVPAHQAAYTVWNSRNERRNEGIVRGNLLASYIHVHFLTNSHWARRFVESARRWRADKG